MPSESYDILRVLCIPAWPAITVTIGLRTRGNLHVLRRSATTYPLRVAWRMNVAVRSLTDSLSTTNCLSLYEEGPGRPVALVICQERDRPGTVWATPRRMPCARPAAWVPHARVPCDAAFSRAVRVLHLPSATQPQLFGPRPGAGSASHTMCFSASLVAGFGHYNYTCTAGRGLGRQTCIIPSAALIFGRSCGAYNAQAARGDSNSPHLLMNPSRARVSRSGASAEGQGLGCYHLHLDARPNNDNIFISGGDTFQTNANKQTTTNIRLTNRA